MEHLQNRGPNLAEYATETEVRFAARKKGLNFKQVLLLLKMLSLQITQAVFLKVLSEDNISYPYLIVILLDSLSLDLSEIRQN